MTSKNDRFFDPKDGTSANVPIIPINAEVFRGKRPFDAKVLVGNWYENRFKFKDSGHRSKPFHQIAYPTHVGSVPDTVFRRRALGSKEQRLGRLILDHHDIDSQKQLISSYDEQYNKRGAYGEHQDNSERKWAVPDNHWLPERSDHPLENTPTSWGLVERKRAQTQFLQRQRTMPDLSEYTNRYIPHRPEEYSSPKYVGIPRLYSSTVERTNSLNNNIYNRSTSLYNRGIPPAIDITDIDHVYSLRRHANVPRSCFYPESVSKHTEHRLQRHTSCLTESMKITGPLTSSMEQMHIQEQIA
ncbi:unnamed protein product [Adineta steineri]|uniref:Uncharacterized protein n=1 Tax=Adineta steineri TaxID=433720 RepID=A0A815QKV6_9BILA|nr:unnamed protein product [Adineta steineri]CAF1464779.1 unnamed protein product [Adineta steineri]